MEEPAQLQIPAAVLVVGLETHVVKVCRMHAGVVTVQRFGSNSKSSFALINLYQHYSANAYTAVYVTSSV